MGLKESELFSWRFRIPGWRQRSFFSRSARANLFSSHLNKNVSGANPLKQINTHLSFNNERKGEWTFLFGRRSVFLHFPPVYVLFNNGILRRRRPPFNEITNPRCGRTLSFCVNNKPPALRERGLLPGRI